MRVKWFVVWGLLLCSPSVILGKDSETVTTPDLELLEFLGSWETSDGQWIDPLELAAPSMIERLRGSGTLELENLGHKEESPNTREKLLEDSTNPQSNSPERDAHE